MKKIAEVNLSDCIITKVEERFYFGKRLTLITHYINSEKIGWCTGLNVKEIRRTLLFAKDKDEKEHFCEVGIIEIGEKFLVTACEYLEARLKFREGNVKIFNYIDTYVASDMRCFLVSKDDIYINYLLSFMNSSSVGSICNVRNSNIENVLLFNTQNMYEYIFFSEEFIIKSLNDILKRKEVYNSLLEVLGYYDNLHWSKVDSNTIKVEYDYDNADDNSQFYSKKFIKEDSLTILNILKKTPKSLFKNTPIAMLVNEESLSKDTKIFLKNNNEYVRVALSSIKDEHNCDIKMGFIITTSIDVAIYQPRPLKDGFESHFKSKEVKIINQQLFEVFKKVLKEKINSDFVFSAVKEK